MERKDSRQTDDFELGECAASLRESVLTIRPGHNELRKERVKRTRNDVARHDSGVDSDSGASGGAKKEHGAGSWAEVGAGVFTVDAELDGVPGDDGVGVIQHAALGDSELFANQVNARDFLGDGVLHLEPRVDFEERDGPIRTDEELAGSRSHVPDLFEDVLGCAVEQVPLLVGDERCGGLFDKFLVAALKRAVSRRDDDDISR